MQAQYFRLYLSATPFELAWSEVQDQSSPETRFGDTMRSVVTTVTNRSSSAALDTHPVVSTRYILFIISYLTMLFKSMTS